MRYDLGYRIGWYRIRVDEMRLDKTRYYDMRFDPVR